MLIIPLSLRGRESSFQLLRPPNLFLVDSRTNKVSLRKFEDNVNSQTTWFRYQNSYTPKSLKISQETGPNMRLVNTKAQRLQKFDQEPLPVYAILSHRRGNQEISSHELQSKTGTEKEGYQKIVSFCTKAKSRGFEWRWVNTCGIDTTSSSELSKAILFTCFYGITAALSTEPQSYILQEH